MKTYPKQMSAILFQRARLNKPTSIEDAKFNQELAEACSNKSKLKKWLKKNDNFILKDGIIQYKFTVFPNDGSLLSC